MDVAIPNGSYCRDGPIKRNCIELWIGIVLADELFKPAVFPVHLWILIAIHVLGKHDPQTGEDVAADKGDYDEKEEALSTRADLNEVVDELHEFTGLQHFEDPDELCKLGKFV